MPGHAGYVHGRINFVRARENVPLFDFGDFRMLQGRERVRGIAFAGVFRRLTVAEYTAILEGPRGTPRPARAVHFRVTARRGPPVPCTFRGREEPPKSRLINRRETYGAKIQGQFMAVEGSEVNGTSCNGAVGGAEVRSKVPAAESPGANRATVNWP